MNRMEFGLRIAGDPPVVARHALWSAVASLDDQRPPPTPRLLRIALDAVGVAAEMDLDKVTRRADARQRGFLDLWPGEHYRLLAALARGLEPSLVVEIGTDTGMGTLSLLNALREPAKVVTYDIVEWDHVANSLFEPSDFGPRLEQRIVDLAASEYFEQESDTLLEADLIFIDGPKDGSFEGAFLDRLVPRLAGKDTVLLLDDIRTIPMLSLWRELPIPKLDLTSFGHWSGTGLAGFG